MSETLCGMGRIRSGTLRGKEEILEWNALRDGHKICGNEIKEFSIREGYLSLDN